MQINISEIISTHQKSQQYDPELDMTCYLLDGEQYPILAKEPVALTIENRGKNIVGLSGRVDVTLDIPCSRCLKSVPTQIDFDFDSEIDFNKLRTEQADDLEDTSFIEDNLLDVDRFVYNEILVRFPAKTLCKEDCKGLCLKCGRDLNEGECGCDREVLDPRMSAIRDVFKNFKEV